MLFGTRHFEGPDRRRGPAATLRKSPWLAVNHEGRDLLSCEVIP